MSSKPKYPAYHEMAMLGREAAKAVRLNNDKLNQRTHMTYEQFCEAVDKEIPAALFHLIDGHPSLPVGATAKVLSYAIHGEDKNHNYYDNFIALLFD